MSRPASVMWATAQEIVRLRQDGVPAKVIARRLGLRPGQVEYQWRQHHPVVTDAEVLAAQQAAARQELAHQVALAREEARTAPLYRGGPQ